MSSHLIIEDVGDTKLKMKHVMIVNTRVKIHELLEDCFEAAKRLSRYLSIHLSSSSVESWPLGLM